MELPRGFHVQCRVDPDLLDHFDSTNGLDGPFDGGDLSQYGGGHFVDMASGRGSRLLPRLVAGVGAEDPVVWVSRAVE